MSAFIQSNILILLHPFIPFFTERVWQDFKFNKYFKMPLMFKDWDIKSQSTFSKSYKKFNIATLTIYTILDIHLNILQQ